MPFFSALEQRQPRRTGLGVVKFAACPHRTQGLPLRGRTFTQFERTPTPRFASHYHGARLGMSKGRRRRQWRCHWRWMEALAGQLLLALEALARQQLDTVQVPPRSATPLLPSNPSSASPRNGTHKRHPSRLRTPPCWRHFHQSSSARYVICSWRGANVSMSYLRSPA